MMNTVEVATKQPITPYQGTEIENALLDEYGKSASSGKSSVLIR